MKIIRKKHGYMCNYDKEEGKTLTWRKVKVYCDQRIEKLKNSKQAEEIKAYEATIKKLQKIVNSFYSQIQLYQGMADAIHDTDKDIDTPFVESDK